MALTPSGTISESLPAAKIGNDCRLVRPSSDIMSLPLRFQTARPRSPDDATQLPSGGTANAALVSDRLGNAQPSILFGKP